VLPVKQPVFAQNAFIALFFLGILALNAVADRFWCRYLCPLARSWGCCQRWRCCVRSSGLPATVALNV